MTDTICFPPHEGLPFTYSPPTIDGFVEPDLGVTSDDASNETGWTRATRFVSGNDSTLPNMEFQCSHHDSQDLMYMSFILRFDQSFDNFDTVIIVLQPNYTAGQASLTADARRIDISPVYDGVGAGTGADDNPGDPFHVRGNRDPRDVRFSKYNPGTNGWDQIPNATLSNWAIKARSWSFGTGDDDWSIEVQLPTKPAGPQGGGASWSDFTGASFGLYVNVLDVCETCATGSFPVETYFSTQYTWPAPDYTQTPPLRIIQDPSPTNPITDLHQAPIPASWLGVASLAASPGTCQGVKFQNGPWGIGVLNPTNPAGPLSITVDTTLNATNTFAARLVNDGAAPANGVTATFRIAEWGVGPGGQTEWPTLPHTSPTGPIYDPTQPPQSVPTGATPTQFTVAWKFDSTDRATFQGNPDRCCWVTLDASPGPVTFAEDSVRLNLNFINLSSSQKEATISGKGHAKPLDGSKDHDFLLYVTKRPIVSTQYTEAKVRGSGPPFGEPPVEIDVLKAVGPRDDQKLKQELPPLITMLFENWAGNQKTINSLLWIVNAYRRSGYILTLGGKKFGIFEHVGGFGHVGDHLGEITGFSDSLSGQGLIRLAEGVYRLPVPVDGAVTIQTRIETIEALNSGFMVQSTFGKKGNFELVVPHASGGLAHCWRDDDAPGFPWHGPTVFGTEVGHVDAVSLIQSNFDIPGHLEVVARVGDDLMHFWRDSGPEFKWHGPTKIADGVSGNPALIQGRYGIRGNFELVVPLASGGIAHYWRNNDDPKFPWARSTVFATQVGHVDAVALIQSNFGQPGQLEVVARVGNELIHFWRDSGGSLAWHGPETIFTEASGIPGFIQSRFGTKGNFDVVTPVSKGGMTHLSRDNDTAVPGPWTVAESFGSGQVTAVSLLESNFTTSPNPAQPGPGNFEVAARIDNSTALYWQRDESPYTWNGPTAHACS